MTAGDIMRRFRRWREGTPEGPLALYLFPTKRCNLTCIFCRYRHWGNYAHQNELDDDEWIRIMRESAECGARWIDLLGGEPLLRKRLVLKLSGLARACGLKGSLVTNGMLFTRDVARQLVANEWDVVQVSVDAPLPYIHNTLRRHELSFSSALRCMDAIDAERRGQDIEATRIQMNLVLTNRILGMLPQMVELARSHGCDRMKFIPMVLSEPEAEELRIPEENSGNLSEEMLTCHRLAEEYGIETNLLDLHASIKKRGTGPEAIRGEMCQGKEGYPLCYAPWWALTVLPDGGVTCCPSSDEELTTIASKSVEKVWGCEEFERVRCQLLSTGIAGCEKCCYVMAAENKAVREWET